MTNPSSASPRYSRRSLLSSPRLRWLRAVVNKPLLTKTYPRVCSNLDKGSFISSTRTTAHGHGFIKVQEQLDVIKQFVSFFKSNMYGFTRPILVFLQFHLFPYHLFRKHSQALNVRIVIKYFPHI